MEQIASNRSPMNMCKTCKFWTPNFERPGSEKRCSCPKMRYSYDSSERDDSDEVLVEFGEGWGILPGPDFGCIHHSPAATVVSISRADLEQLRDCSDLEMRDGDAARSAIQAWLDR
jgi:hypothetical protein